MYEYFFYMGIIFAALIGVALLLMVLSLFLAGQAGDTKKPSRKIRLPRITLISIMLMRHVLKRIYKMFGRDPLVVDATGVIAHNQIYESYFRRAYPGGCAVLLPQCLRDSKCPARLDPHKGIDCKMCGLCVVKEIKEISKGMNVIVIPGGTFGKRMLEEQRPATVLGVACPMELFDGLMLTDALGIPAVGVLLDRYGCVETKVSVGPIAEFLGRAESREGDTARAK